MMLIDRNATADYQFTIIVPVYNEEENMARIEQVMKDYLPHCRYQACVLFVNDGSKDQSLSLIKEVCNRNESFFYLSFQKNCGLSAAMKAGIDYAQSDFIGYIDADLQTTPEDFNLLLAHIQEHALVMGIRANRKDSFFKNIQSKIANGFRRMMTNDQVQDTGCPLKVMQSRYAKKIPFFTGMHRFLPALIQLQGGSYYQMPVQHFPRMAGVSKYNFRNRSIAPFVDCFAYRWMRSRYFNYVVDQQNLDQ